MKCHTGAAIIHAQLDSCSYVASKSCLMPNYQADEWPFQHAAPAFVAFDWQQPVPGSRWATSEESMVSILLSECTKGETGCVEANFFRPPTPPYMHGNCRLQAAV